MEQRIQLSDHFGFGRLIRFTIPSILMMIFTSIYGVVDGYFVSNFVGKTPFAAVNFIMPFLMVVGAMGFMFGTGGSALIARIMGEGRREKAQEIFSLLIAATVISGLVIAVTDSDKQVPTASVLVSVQFPRLHLYLLIVVPHFSSVPSSTQLCPSASASFSPQTVQNRAVVQVAAMPGV